MRHDPQATRDDGSAGESAVPLDRLIQRCVDGELTDRQERSLLLRLESSQGGWRALATAFLEDRALRVACEDELQSVRRMPAAAPRVDARQRPWRLAVVVAACVAVAVAFGAGRWSGAPVDDAVTVAGNRDDAGDDAKAAAPGKGDLEADDAARLQPSAPAAGPQPLMYVSLVNEEDGDELASVPVYGAADASEAWRTAVPPLSKQVISDLRQSGYDVSSQWDVLTVPTSDGQEILLPINLSRIQPARF
jgi:hypothetical protein